MKLKILLPIGLMCFSLSLVGCNGKNNSNNSGTNDTTSETEIIDDTNIETETTDDTNPSISNRINGLFGTDGMYNTNNGTNQPGSNQNYGYSSPSDERFGFGMDGAENIKGNENNSSVITDSKNLTNDIINDTEKIGDNLGNDLKSDWNKMKNSIKN